MNIKIKNQRCVLAKSVSFGSFFLLFFIVFSLGTIGFVEKSIAIAESPVVRVIATVNIDYAQILSRNGNRFDIVFSVSNREKVQGDIKYSIGLKPKGNSTDFIDSYTFPDSFSLREKDSLTKKIEFIAPSFLKGEHEMVLSLKNKEGLPLGIYSLGIVNLEGAESFIEIKPESCKFIVVGDSKSFSLLQGVDIKKEEKLFLECNLENKGDVSEDLYGVFETYYRSDFGDPVITEKGESWSFRMERGEKKKLKFLVPKPASPQAYHIKFFINQKEKKKSNSIYGHYVLRGESASISNISLNKDFFAKGDEVKILVLWAGSADRFPNSRFSETTVDALKLKVALRDGKNKDCIQTVEKDLKNAEIQVEFSNKALLDCEHPLVVAEIFNQEGKLLASKELGVKTISPSALKTKEEVKQKKETSEDVKKLLAIIGIIIVLFILVIVVKNKMINKKVRLNIFLFFFFTLAGGLGFSGKEVLGDTYEIQNLPNGSGGDIVFEGHGIIAVNVSYESSGSFTSWDSSIIKTFNPFQKIKIDTSFFIDHSCGNVAFNTLVLKTYHDKKGDGNVNIGSNGAINNINDTNVEQSQDLLPGQSITYDAFNCDELIAGDVNEVGYVMRFNWQEGTSFNYNGGILHHPFIYKVNCDQNSSFACIAYKTPDGPKIKETNQSLACGDADGKHFADFNAIALKYDELCLLKGTPFTQPVLVKGSDGVCSFEWSCGIKSSASCSATTDCPPVMPPVNTQCRYFYSDIWNSPTVSGKWDSNQICQDSVGLGYVSGSISVKDRGGRELLNPKEMNKDYGNLSNVAKITWECKKNETETELCEMNFNDRGSVNMIETR